jgi:hypothetical protein
METMHAILDTYNMMQEYLNINEKIIWDLTICIALNIIYLIPWIWYKDHEIPLAAKLLLTIKFVDNTEFMRATIKKMGD